MNESLRTADRSTHARVALLAISSCAVFVAVGMGARATTQQQVSSAGPAQLIAVNVRTAQTGKRLVEAKLSFLVDQRNPSDDLHR